jgi:hypothetical protein
MVIPIKRIECNPAQKLRLSFGAGQWATDEGIRKIIEEDGAGAYYGLVDAGHTLEAGQRNEATRKVFQQVFGRSPDELPGPAAQWDFGRIVAERFARTHDRTFLPPQLVVSCWGWPWPGGGPFDPPEKYRVRAHENVPRIGLGAWFWKDRIGNDLDSLGLALFGAGLTIRYGLSWSPLAPPFRNVHCYLRFGLEVRNLVAPSWVRDGCSQAVAVRAGQGGRRIG